MKKLATILIAAAMTLAVSAKEKLNVLYVGGSSNIETTGAGEVDPTAVAKSAKERAASFTKFLRKHFTDVTVVDAKDYTADMSKKFDVTVFDGRPKYIRPEICETDAAGRVIRYERPAYLPDDFDCASLCIASASEDLGRSIGTKNDWYCLCLDNYALGWDKDHPIFKGPFKVDITPETRPTPSAAREAAPMYGQVLPAEMEMWKVSENSYGDPANQGIRLGMVSRPGGYLDSPEAEVISGGVSIKTIDAVALGRHGNFFHWGFASDPDGLTPAGREALANAIVYIAQFNGKPIIARKKNEGIATRDHVQAMKWMTSRDAWEDTYNVNLQFYNSMDSTLKVIDAKKAAGEELTPMEMMYAQMPAPQKPVQIPYAEYVKQREPKLYHVFGADADEYARYYDRNLPYFYPDESGYHLDIDEELRALGYGSNDIRMLDNAISLLEQGGLDAPTAKTVLERYTLCRFDSPAQWRAWFNENKDKLFFTESGGYLWLVNSYDPDVVGNDYSILEAKETPAAVGTGASSSAETDENNPVALAAEVVKAADGTAEMVLTMTIHPGFHAYATVDPDEPFVVTKVSADVPEGITKIGDIIMPAAKPTSNATTFYEGTVQFRQKIEGKATGEADWNITYQVCNNTVCKIPETKTVSAKL